MRAAAAAALLMLPVQILVAQRFREPYPALTQPGFGRAPTRGHVMRHTAADVLVSFDDGSQQVLASDEFLSGIATQGVPFLRHAFSSEDSQYSRDPAIRRWAYKRAEQATGRRDISQVVVRWIAHEMDLSSRSDRTTLNSLVLVRALR